MPTKDLLNSLNAKANYENFSEEVQILSVTETGSMSLYSVKNKNGVTFSNVPGLVGLQSRGYMGYVNGDRARPIMISGLASSAVVATDVSSEAFDDVPGVDISETVGWDIQLTAVSTIGNDTEEKTFYIVV